MKLIFVTFIILSILQCIFCGCPDGWIFSPHDSKCYKVSNTLSGWNVGEYNCAFIGGHLASIHSLEQNQFLWELGRRIGKYIWVGAAQFGNNPNYVYADGSPFNYEKWNYGKRPSFRRGKRCIKIDTSTGLWEQSCCKKKSVPICVKDPKLYPGWGTSSSEEMKKSTTTLPSPFLVEKKEETDNFAAAVDGFQKVYNLSKQEKRPNDSSFEFKLKNEEPINEGSDGFGKVIKLTDTMPNVDATNPILANPDNRERVILTTIRNDNVPLEAEEGKDRLDGIVRSPLKKLNF
ncbi:C-type lectin domain and C-type lectin-like domain and C-type lectin fold domain-containing protein [Strongyloides ratti]|uniref:C-type lectin domain and C-type lectin-like domain and C-type lectin fold domain-containing protein n=1 Tax=Strongyloides ratti TaxID=34506 RepID=A0A090N069_STRRB|nr:C-type lectin domain and C-type lectin-like domain and C-type lectin fold domain-containing protein [Strongyloides ratti]CEF70165.1 C-type lectin domain and C-type lectin-like domain and C-type lectin fold domain-containing protein [Strongyloides ratti]